MPVARLTHILTLFILIAASIGCSKSSTARLDTATASMGHMRTQLADASMQIDRLVESMTTLDSGQNLKKSFDTFSNAVDRLEGDAEEVRARNAAMKARGKEHADAWHQELSKVQTQQARAIGEQRQAVFTQQVASLQESMNTLKTAYDPFITKLKDIRLILANDLDPSGLGQVGPLMKESISEAGEVKKRIGETSALLTKVETEFSGRNP